MQYLCERKVSFDFLLYQCSPDLIELESWPKKALFEEIFRVGASDDFTPRPAPEASPTRTTYPFKVLKKCLPPIATLLGGSC